MQLRKPLRVLWKVFADGECCAKTELAQPAFPVICAHEFQDNRLHAQIVGL